MDLTKARKYARDLKLILENGNSFAFRTFHNTYLTADRNDENLHCDRDQIKAWEVFKIINLGKGYVALKGSNGKYVRAVPDEEVRVDAFEIKEWETFRVWIECDKIAFLSCHGTWLTANKYGVVSNSAYKKDTWEVFTMIQNPYYPPEPQTFREMLKHCKPVNVIHRKKL